MYCTECGNALSDSFKFCAVCGHAVLKVPSVQASEVSESGAESTVPTSNAPSVPNTRDRSYLIGVVVFVGFSLLGLLGRNIIGILEAVGWGFAAWFWYKKKPTHPAATIAVMLLAVFAIAGEIWFYERHHPRTPPFDLDAYRSSESGGTTEFVPPDTSGIEPSQKYASCREANRLATACGELQFKPSSPFAPYGGYSAHLAKITSVPKGFQLDPNQKDCDTAFEWKSYCDANK